MINDLVSQENFRAWQYEQAPSLFVTPPTR